MDASLVCIVSSKPDPTSKSHDVGASKKFQRLKVPATKPDDQSLVPKPHMIEGKGPLLKPELHTPVTDASDPVLDTQTHTKHTHTYTQRNLMR